MIVPPNTVFVLGAGASVPYGLPSGRQLCHMIAELRRKDLNNDTLKATLKVVLEAVGFGQARLQEVVTDITRSGVPSIDVWAACNRAYAPIAKILIAGCLLQLEDDRWIVPDGEVFKEDGDWLGYLLNDSIDAAGTADQCAIVTFNFDRVIERRLLTMFEARFGMSEQQAAKHAAQFPIVHVSGILGRPEWQAIDNRDDLIVPFGVRHQALAVVSAARQIQFVYETRAEPALQTAHTLINDAPLVVFLGFGFHPANVASLHIRGTPSQPIFIGSAWGMTSAEAREIEARFPEPGRLRLHERYDALNLLRNA